MISCLTESREESTQPVCLQAFSRDVIPGLKSWAKDIREMIYAMPRPAEGGTSHTPASMAQPKESILQKR